MNIKFLEVDIDNFLSVGKINFPIRSGLTSLIGKNNTDSYSESNGSGKSSIVESLIWCLSGSTTRGVASDAVINNNDYERGCKVVVDLEVDSDLYKVTRTRGGSYGNTLKVVKNNEDISGNTMKKSQSILEELIPMSYEDLTSCIILAQDMPNKLSNLSPSGRKSKLEKIANYDDKIESIKSNLSSKLREVEDNLKELSTKSCSYKTSLIPEMKKTLEKLNNDYTNHCKELENLGQYNKEIEDYNKNLKDKFEDDLNELSRSEEKLSEINNQYEGFYRKVVDKQGEISLLTSDINQLKTTIKFYESQIKQKRNEKLKLSDGICITCHRPLDNRDEILAISKRYDKEISKIKKDIELEQVKINSLSENLSQLESDKSEIEKAGSEIKGTKSLLEGKVSRLRLSTRSVEYKPLKSLTDNRDNLLSSIKEKENDILKVEKNIETIDQDIEKLTVKKANISRIVSDISRGSFRNFLLNKTMINFNHLLAQISIELMKDEPVQLQFDGNKIEIVYNNKYYEQMSGGEKKRIDIAVELTIRKYKSLVSGINFDLLVMDETFDSLDKKGITSLFDAVEASGTTDKFIVISHREDACLNYDNRVVVCKENGFSKLI